MTSPHAAPPCRTPHTRSPPCSAPSLTRTDTLDVGECCQTGGHCPHEHSLWWSSVSAVRPPPKPHCEGGTHDGMQSSTGGTSGAPACVSNAATPWLCTGAAPTHTSLTRHTRKGAARDMTGRASDGSDSYSCMWSVAVCGSAISGENSCAAEGGAKGWSGYHGEA